MPGARMSIVSVAGGATTPITKCRSEPEVESERTDAVGGGVGTADADM